MIDPRKVVFRVHAIRRMFERGFAVRDVLHVLETGVVVADYPDDKPYPIRLLLGSREGRPIHVVAADDVASGEMIVVTVYEPDLDHWEPGFERRRA